MSGAKEISRGLLDFPVEVIMKILSYLHVDSVYNGFAYVSKEALQLATQWTVDLIHNRLVSLDVIERSGISFRGSVPSIHAKLFFTEVDLEGLGIDRTRYLILHLMRMLERYQNRSWMDLTLDVLFRAGAFWGLDHPFFSRQLHQLISIKNLQQYLAEKATSATTSGYKVVFEHLVRQLSKEVHISPNKGKRSSDRSVAVLKVIADDYLAPEHFKDVCLRREYIQVFAGSISVTSDDSGRYSPNKEVLVACLGRLFAEQGVINSNRLIMQGAEGSGSDHHGSQRLNEDEMRLARCVIRIAKHRSERLHRAILNCIKSFGSQQIRKEILDVLELYGNADVRLQMKKQNRENQYGLAAASREQLERELKERSEVAKDLLARFKHQVKAVTKTVLRT
jgi:hypothetical protein